MINCVEKKAFAQTLLGLTTTHQSRTHRISATIQASELLELDMVEMIVAGAEGGAVKGLGART
jgi:hypothetical protein